MAGLKDVPTHRSWWVAHAAIIGVVGIWRRSDTK